VTDRDRSLSDFTQHGSDHLAVRGLLTELPRIGEVWPEERRRDWLDAMEKTLALLYEREEPA
jgi:hypothetical protein